MSLTVSLMAFSGATPYGDASESGRKVCRHTHNQLWAKTTIKAFEALIPENLLHAVQRVLIQ